MPILNTKNSTKNEDELKQLGYKIPKSGTETETNKQKCYECLNARNGNGLTLCKEVQCPKDTEETPSDDEETTSPSSEPSGTQEQTFDDDKHLSTLDSSTISKIAKVWGVRPDTFYKEIGNVRFYATSKPKVYLGSYDSELALIKDRKSGDEGTNQSTFTVDKLKTMSETEMQTMLNRVSLIPENKKMMKNILKEEFQKRENDKNIISKRFNILSESKKTWTASNLISEVSYLKKQNYSSVLIKEGLVELMKSLYDDDPTFIPKIKDSYKGWLMKKLPNESELFKKSLETSIEDLENDSVPALFTDCNKVVEMMYEAMIKGMVDEKFDVVGVPKDIEDLLRSEIIDNIKKDEFKSKVKQQLTNKICPQYGDLLKNTQKTFDDIKNKLVS